MNCWIDKKDVENGARNAVVLPLSSLTKAGSSAIDRSGVEALARKFGKTDFSGDIIIAAGITVARAAYESVVFSKFLEEVSADLKRIAIIISDTTPLLKGKGACCH